MADPPDYAYVFFYDAQGRELMLRVVWLPPAPVLQYEGKTYAWDASVNGYREAPADARPGP